MDYPNYHVHPFCKKKEDIQCVVIMKIGVMFPGPLCIFVTHIVHIRIDDSLVPICFEFIRHRRICILFRQ